jgi:Protein of unknown function (DUF3558)
VAAVTTIALTVGCAAQIQGSPAVAVPRDRDSGAVVAALRELSACALIDPAVAGRVGIGSAPIVYAEAPHACTISAAPSSGGYEVTVHLGTHADHFLKWASAPITLAGAKAYRYDDSLKGHNCFVFLPVSFDRAIQIYAKEPSTGSDIDLCAAATAFAEAAATKLANPDSLRPDRTTFPLSQWDGCSLLAAALGEEAERYPLTLTEPGSTVSVVKLGVS